MLLLEQWRCEIDYRAWDELDGVGLTRAPNICNHRKSSEEVSMSFFEGPLRYFKLMTFVEKMGERPIVEEFLRTFMSVPNSVYIFC